MRKNIVQKTNFCRLLKKRYKMYNVQPGIVGALVGAVQTESGKRKEENGKLNLGSIFKLIHRKRLITKHTPHRFAELPYLKGALLSCIQQTLHDKQP